MPERAKGAITSAALWRRQQINRWFYINVTLLMILLNVVLRSHHRF